MCVAIVKPAGFRISEEILRRCWKNNNDGCGIAYIKHAKGKGKAKNKMCVYHSLGLNPFLKELGRVEEEYPNFPMLLHFRATSKGETSLSNCHPFIIDKDHAFVHNGTIAKVDDDPMKLKSDTAMFNETIMQKLPAGWFGNPAVQEIVEDYIGFSKLAMLRIDGKVMIFNEKKGDESDEGVWFSNTQWRVVTTSYKYNRNNNTSTKGADWKSRHDDYDSDASAYGQRENPYDDGTYDDHTDLTKWCTKQGAYHGQNRFDDKSNQYQKYDYWDMKWLRLADWKDKWLSGKKKTEEKADNHSKDDAQKPVENIYELTSEDITELAEDLGIGKEEQDFQLELTDTHGSTDLVDFARCEMCWEPDYASYIRPVTVDTEEISLCDGCEHELVIHGMIPKQDVED